MTKIAFLGTGLLGSGMVECLLGRGHAVTVWNRTESKARRLEPLGASLAPTAEAAVASAHRVHLVLPDDDVVDAVLDRIQPHLAPGAVVLDHSTTLPARTRERLPRRAAQGMHLLHAPVFMSPQMAREAKGMMLVSGAASDFDTVKPALEEMTGQVGYLGERPDLAAAYKLFGNSMLFVLAGGVADVMAIARGADVEPADAVKLFETFPVGAMLAARGSKMVSGDFSASFELTMARKDMRLMLETAGERPLAVLPGVAARMDAAIAEGHGHEDVGVIAAALVK